MNLRDMNPPSLRQFTVILGFILAMSGVAAAQTASPRTPPMTPAERDYIAVRDAAIARIKARIDATNKVDDTTSAEDRKSLAELEMRLRAIIGPMTVAGFGAVTKSNLDTLIQELGFGQMDGLTAMSADQKSSVIVTTVPLFMHWLRTHKTWWGKNLKDLRGAPMPQDIAGAVRSEAFYTQATPQGAAMVAYGTLAVTKPDGVTLASAILGARTQDGSPPAPGEMFVTFVKGGRVFIGNAPLAQEIKPDPACDALRATYGERARQAFEAYRASGLKDKKQIDRSQALETEGDEAQRQCFADKMPAEARAQAVKQAQAMIDAMSGK